MTSDFDKMFSVAMEHNLNEIVRFHRFVREELHSRFKESDGDKHAEATLHNHDDRLTINCFLMAYAYLEEYLYLLWRTKRPSFVRERASSIKRYAPVLEDLGYDTRSSTWKFLLEATDIRHCLLHANGRVSMMTKPPQSRFEALVSKYSNEIEIHLDRLRLGVGYLARTVETIHRFRDEVNATA
jgi:hypothetical protein